MLHKALHCYSNLGLFDIRTHGANPLGIHINLISVHDSGKPLLVVTRRGKACPPTLRSGKPVHRVPPVQGTHQSSGEETSWLYLRCAAE